MNTPQQKAPIPAPMMPWGFTGESGPPAEYGDLTSPSIVPDRRELAERSDAAPGDRAPASPPRPAKP